MIKPLKEKTFVAIIWSLIDRFGQQIILFVLGIILSRYFLTANDYGLVSLVAILNVIALVVLDSGFNSALIRNTDAQEIDFSSVFVFNVAMSICIYLLVFASAPYIATYFKQDLLINLCRVNALIFVFNSFAHVILAKINKEARFKLLAKINLISLLLSSSISLVLAFYGFGVWVLVIQSLSFAIIRNICIRLMYSWSPRVAFSFQRLQSMWKYSFNILIAGIVNSLFSQFCPILIGRYYPIAQVGYYSQANKFVELPSVTMAGSLQAATFPILSQIKNDRERLKRAFRKTIRVAALIVIPLLCGLAVVAKPLILFLLTAKWISLVPYLQILAIGAICTAFTNININMLYVLGDSAMFLKFEFTRKLITILLLLVVANYGVLYLVSVMSIVNVLGFIVISQLVGRKINYTVFELLKDIFPYAGIATLMVIVVHCLNGVIDSTELLLVSQILVGSFLYLSLIYLFGSVAFKEGLELLTTKTNNNPTAN